jgi:outer membrane protein assembly factor BamB
MKALIPFCFLAACPFVVADSSTEQGWPRWRGPSDSGSSVLGKYAAEWSASNHLQWKLALPGKGCSTPIVYDEQILLTSPLDGDDAVLSVDWNGEIRWQTRIGAEREGRHRNGSGSNPSPVVDETGIYVYFKSGAVAGLGLDGSLRWKINLQERYGADSLYWDIGSSPVATAENVIVPVMHDQEGYVVAIHKQTGAIEWKVDRTYKTPTENDHSYTTPLLIDHEGNEAVLIWGAEHLTAHDPSDGSVLWSCGGFDSGGKANWVAVASAVIVGDVAVVPYGRGSKLAGIKMGGNGDVTQSHRIWEKDDIGSFVPTPAANQGTVYVLRDRGEVVAVDPKSGEVRWKANFPKHRSSYYASPVIADSKLYATREDGTILVADISAEFKLLAQNDLGERMIASPVPVGDRLLLRGEKHLFCVSSN